MEVNRQGLTLHLTVHPILRVNRGGPTGAGPGQVQGAGPERTLMGVLPDDSPAGQRESFIHLEVDRVSDAARLESLAADIARVLMDARATV